MLLGAIFWTPAGFPGFRSSIPLRASAPTPFGFPPVLKHSKNLKILLFYYSIILLLPTFAVKICLLESLLTKKVSF